MKTDRQNRSRCQTRVKQDRSRRFVRIFGTSVLVAIVAAMASLRGSTAADGLDSAADPNTTAGQASTEQRAVSHQRASKLLEEVIRQFADGPPFIAKVRETVWATGREVVGVGTYEQAGQGSGQFNLQITMHDGDGKHQPG